MAGTSALAIVLCAKGIASRSLCFSLGLHAELRNEPSNQGLKAGV
jgi:hypothetical protein